MIMSSMSHHSKMVTTQWINLINDVHVLYITDTCNQSEPIVGYAGPCAYANNKNNQPYMGFINICPMV